MSDLTIEHLLEDCLSGEPSRQAPAIMKLQELEAYEAVPILIELLAPPVRNIRGCAIEALGWLGYEDSESIGHLLLNILNDSDELIRSDTFDALARLEYKPAVEAARDLLKNDPDWVVRASAAEALADIACIGDSETLADLESALNDPIEPVRSYAACSIGLLGTPTSELLDKLEMYFVLEEDLATKAEILGAKYRLGCNGDLQKLLQLLSGADELLVSNIFNILEDLTERQIPKSLTKYLSDIEKALRQAIQSFPIFRNQAEEIIAQLKSINIQENLLGDKN